ncbi:MAG: hypothetical protein LBQ57_02960 [Spirochaetales bacterium]|nr:hypothetical protein [Spirochaetales bacterium]
MNRRDEDYRAFFDLVGSEKKRLSGKRALLKALENELEKGEDAVDPVLAEALVNGLYEAEGVESPLVTEQETEDCIARITGRRKSGRMPRLKKARLNRPRSAVKWAAALCGIILFVFSVNYITALVSGACLVSRIEPVLCCGTKYCPCDLEGREKAPQ